LFAFVVAGRLPEWCAGVTMASCASSIFILQLDRSMPFQLCSSPVADQRLQPIVGSNLARILIRFVHQLI
jgi:hypothetical protein